MFFIVWGWKGRAKTIGQGSFNCPHCRGQRQYEHKKVQRWFTLYFIPLFPTATLGEAITCSGCNQSYTPEVLQYDPAKHQAEQNERTAGLWRAAMITVACAFGPANGAQAEAIREGLVRNFQITSDATEITADCRMAPVSGVPLDEIIGRASSLSQLDLTAKENFLLTAVHVMKAASSEAQQQHEILTKLGQALGLTDAHVRGILAS